MKTAQIVLGLCFGDEGKGLTTSYLYDQKPNSLNIRFNGTCQAGHNVVVDDKSHIFSHFGASTLQGGATYWSKECPVHPTNFFNEYEALRKKSPPTFSVHPLCPVVTPYEILLNRNDSNNMTHGTVGAGFGKTIERELNGFSLVVKDLRYPEFLRAKLLSLRDFYYKNDNNKKIFVNPMQKKEKDYIEKFIEDCSFFMDRARISFEDVTDKFDNLIFEGAQGILLDQKHGFFPNVTRSNTTSLNALKFLESLEEQVEVNIYYVMRSYLTRHGNGYLPNECSKEELNLVGTENETNVTNEFQNNFRYARHSLDLLKYALESDFVNHFQYRFSKLKIKKNLIVTCLDQTQGTIKFLDDDWAFGEF